MSLTHLEGDGARLVGCKPRLRAFSGTDWGLALCLFFFPCKIGIIKFMVVEDNWGNMYVKYLKPCVSYYTCNMMACCQHCALVITLSLMMVMM